jgi:probable HAF family extracellular repeat protein
MAFVAEDYTTVPNPDLVNPDFNDPLGINDAGTVSGYYNVGNDQVAYTMSPAGDYTFPSPQAYAEFGWNIYEVRGTTNNGVSFGNAQAADGSVGYIDNNGSFAALPGSELLGMNDLGEAVGLNLDAQDNPNPFIYNMATGLETPLTFQGVAHVNVAGINDYGQMVGTGIVTSTGLTEGLYLDGRGGLEFLAPPGATQSGALGLNNTGQIVGDYTDTAGQTHGFLFDIATQAYTTLDDPYATGGVTSAQGINDYDQVVGYYTDAQNVPHGFEIQIAHT